MNLSWAVGLLEGEGCFSFFKRPNRNNYQCAIICEMTDEDTIKTLQKVLGVGNITTRIPKKVNRKQSWILSIQRQEDIFNTLIKIMPYLHKRRLEQAKKMYNYLEDICTVN